MYFVCSSTKNVPVAQFFGGVLLFQTPYRNRFSHLIQIWIMHLLSRWLPSTWPIMPQCRHPTMHCTSPGHCGKGWWPCCLLVSLSSVCLHISKSLMSVWQECKSFHIQYIDKNWNSFWWMRSNPYETVLKMNQLMFDLKHIFDDTPNWLHTKLTTSFLHFICLLIIAKFLYVVHTSILTTFKSALYANLQRFYCRK